MKNPIRPLLLLRRFFSRQGGRRMTELAPRVTNLIIVAHAKVHSLAMTGRLPLGSGRMRFSKLEIKKRII